MPLPSDYKIDATLLALIMDNVPGLLAYADAEERYVYVNKAYADWYGYPPAFFHGKFIRDILRPEVYQRAAPYYRRALSGQTVTFENRAYDHSGQERVVQVNFIPHTDAQHNTLGFFSQIYDITERYQMETRLRAIEARFRLLTETARDFIIMHNLHGEILYANPAVLQAGDYHAEDLVGHPIHDFIPQTYHAALQQRAQQRLAGAIDSYSYEIEFVTRAGQRIPIETVSSAFVQEDGLHGVLIVGRDLSERRTAEATLGRRAAQLTVLNTVGQQITALLDLEQLLQHAATLIQERFDYQHVGLFLTDSDAGKLVMRAKAGQFAYLFPPGHSLALGQGMVGWVAQTGQLLLANDVRQEPRFVNLYPELVPTAAELTVPLCVEQTVLGVLDVQSARINAFDENDVTTIVTLAGQIAVALKNAQLYANVQAQQTQTEALRRASAALVGTLSLEEVLDRLLDQINALIANDTANIMLIEGEWVRVVRARGYEKFDCQDFINGLVYHLPDMPSLMQIQTSSRPLIIADTYENPLWTPHPRAAWLRSYTGVPLRIHGQVIGFLNVDSATPNFFTEADAERLAAFANQAAAVLENARLFEAIQVERDRLNILYTVTRQLAAAATREDIAQVLANALPLIGVRDYDLLLLNAGGGRPWLQSSVPEHTAFNQRNLQWYVERILESGLENWVRRERQTAVIPDTHADPRWLTLPGHEEREPVRAVICLPLLNHLGEVVGFLSFAHPAPYPFSAEEQQLAEELAARVAGALENTALHEETRRRLAREEQLNTLAHTLGGEVRLEALLERFLPAITALTGAEAATIGLYDSALQQLRYPYHYHLPDAKLDMTLDINTGIAGRAFREGRTLMVEDYQAYPDALPAWVAVGIHTALIIPLWVEYAVIGVLELYTLSAPRPFDAEAQAAAEAAARLVSVALQRAQLFEAERAQRMFAEALAAAAAALNSSHDPEQILEVILEQITHALPGDAYSIMLIQDAEVRLVGRRDHYAVGENISATPTFRVADAPGLQQMIDTGEPRLVIDTRQDPLWTASIGQEWIRSYIGAPIRIRDITVGFLNVNGQQPGRFSPKDAQRLKAFASQVAVALENTRLYQQLQHYTQQLEREVQKRTAQLQAQFARSTAILNSSTDGMIVTDSQGNLLQTNPVAQTWLERVLSAEDVLQLQQTIEVLVLRAAEHPAIELNLNNLDLELNTAPIDITPPDPAAIVISAHDITQYKTLERMKSQFISNVSHELRTPITTILLYASMLQKQKPEKHAEYLKSLMQEAERLARLVEDVLQISRLDAGRLEIKVRPIDLNELIQSIYEKQRKVAQTGGLDLSFTPDAAAPRALADPERLRQILHNLLQNAFNFTGPGGRVMIDTELHAGEGRWAAINIRDTGIGIPAEELPHIFERFFRGLEPRRRQLRGSGLGLAIAKETLERQGGRITVESRLGQGSTFTVWLPLAEN